MATAACHTDLYHLFENVHTNGFPTVLGHEAAGIVESVGPGVTEYQPGQLVQHCWVNYFLLAFLQSNEEINGSSVAAFQWAVHTLEISTDADINNMAKPTYSLGEYQLAAKREPHRVKKRTICFCVTVSHQILSMRPSMQKAHNHCALVETQHLKH